MSPYNHHVKLILITSLVFSTTHLSSAGDRVTKKTIRLGGKDNMGFTAEERFKDIFELTGELV